MKPDKFKEETFNNEENQSLGYCFKGCTHFPMGGTWLNQGKNIEPISNNQF